MTGPNRSLRNFQGDATAAGQHAEVTTSYAPAPDTDVNGQFKILNGGRFGSHTVTVSTDPSGARRFTGPLETGAASVSGRRGSTDTVSGRPFALASRMTA